MVQPWESISHYFFSHVGRLSVCFRNYDLHEAVVYFERQWFIKTDPLSLLYLERVTDVIACYHPVKVQLCKQGNPMLLISRDKAHQRE